MAWFDGHKRRDDFDTWHSGSFDLVKQVEAVPLDLIPKGKARDQLILEARDGGPLIDVYRTSAPGYGDNYRARNHWAYVIERPLRGRHDSRWSAEEWRIWVEAGMMDAPCMLCLQPPATFALDPEYQIQGGRVHCCYSCHCAIEGIHGYEAHAILNPCPKCGQAGLQIDPEISHCLMCYLRPR